VGELAGKPISGTGLRATVSDYGRNFVKRKFVKTTPRRVADPSHAQPRISLGYLAPLTLLAALALAAVAFADGASRSGRTWGGPIFWASIFACAAPFAYRLCGSHASRAERLGLVVAFGFWLYLIKILRDPTAFTYADELVHSYNVQQIVVTHSLFAANPILSLTPRYPGLETVTAAVRLVGGTSTFGAGVVVIGLARLLMMLALFLFFERISRSARIGGLAALLYTANANFVFFDAEFSYESFAVPLALVTAYAVLRWMEIKEAELAAPEKGRFESRHGWAAVAVLTTPVVVVTHHISSYVLAGFIFAIGRVQREVRRLWKTYATPFPFAAFATIAILAWLIFMARSTWHYLTPVVSAAVGSALDTFGGHEAPRQLFSSGGHGPGAASTPIWDRSVAVSAAVLATLGLPFGLRHVWRHHRKSPAHVVLAVAGAAYVLSLGLRLVPAAWETANRASEFLFFGVALMLAFVGLERWRPRFAPSLGRIAVAVAFGVLLEGGVVSGWSSDLVLAKTFQLKAGGATLYPEGVTAAEWAGQTLGPGRLFAADASNARLLAAYGDEFARAGTNPDVRAVIRDPRLDGWHVRLLRSYRIPYVLVDRRQVSEDALAGYFFATAASPPSWRAIFDARSVHKFDRQPAVERLYDSGDIVVYNVSRLIGEHAP
jgi:hypothetical protein